MNLFVGAGTRPSVHSRTVRDGGCVLARPVKVFTADGAGEISGNRLDASWSTGGGCILEEDPHG